MAAKWDGRVRVHSLLAVAVHVCLCTAVMNADARVLHRKHTDERWTPAVHTANAQLTTVDGVTDMEGTVELGRDQDRHILLTSPNAQSLSIPQSRSQRAVQDGLQKQKANASLPADLACGLRNLTQVIRYRKTGCVGVVTVAVCSGFCKTTTRATKEFPFLKTTYKSCQMLDYRPEPVWVYLKCPLRRRHHGGMTRRTRRFPLQYATKCGCKEC
eukprot:scpid58882/ scgid14163/ 